VTPFGLAGGLNAGPNRLVLNPDTDDEESLGMHSVGLTVKPGDRLRYQSNGGGGFGDPWDRDPEAVARDVTDEYLSPEHARDVYGVVVVESSDGFDVDEEATKALRAGERTPFESGYGPWQVHPKGVQVVPEP
jgi:N-methylhydantoinase B/oxoprolinase/acetone carboxylase alpha subunit